MSDSWAERVEELGLRRSAYKPTMPDIAEILDEMPDWYDADYVQVPVDLLECDEINSLSGAAFKLMIYIYSAYNGLNNGFLDYPEEEAKREIGFSAWKYRSCIRELESKKVLMVTETGFYVLTWLPNNAEHRKP